MRVSVWQYEDLRRIVLKEVEVTPLSDKTRHNKSLSEAWIVSGFDSLNRAFQDVLFDRLLVPNPAISFVLPSRSPQGVCRGGILSCVNSSLGVFQHHIFPITNQTLLLSPALARWIEHVYCGLFDQRTSQGKGKVLRPSPWSTAHDGRLRRWLLESWSTLLCHCLAAFFSVRS